MHNPLVSIIIPVYNAEKYITQCIASAQAQTYANIEIIIIDDGSADKSFETARSLKRDNTYIYRQANQGASAARNYGLSRAKGKYIQFLDADDLLSPDKIASQVLLLNNDDDKIALCDTIHFNDGTDPYQFKPSKEWFNQNWNDPVDFLLKLYAGHEIIPDHGGMIQPNAWLTPRKLIDKAGLWNNFRCPDDDGEFFCRVILVSNGIKYSKTGINYYRKYIISESLSGQKNKEAFQNILLAIDLKYGYLKAKTNNKILDHIFARHYWDLGVAAYPKFKVISDTAIKKAKKLGYKGPKYTSGKIATFLSKILGWRLVRMLSYVYYYGI